LPGKDKKFAITLCSVIKNSITSRFNTADFKLLLSFIPATFPEDGKDSYTLLESYGLIFNGRHDFLHVNSDEFVVGIPLENVENILAAAKSPRIKREYLEACTPQHRVKYIEFFISKSLSL
jgi:hypothetical protein